MNDFWEGQARLFVASFVLAVCLKSLGLGSVPGSSGGEIRWWHAAIFTGIGIVAPGAMIGALAGQVAPIEFGRSAEPAKEVGA